MYYEKPELPFGVQLRVFGKAVMHIAENKMLFQCDAEYVICGKNSNNNKWNDLQLKI